MRLGPSPCILMAMSLMLSTMSVTSSRTPAIDENSCNTPSMCTDCTAAPCSDDNRMRRSALPSVTPKPRSSGSATTVASRLGSTAGGHLELVGSDQFLPVLLDRHVGTHRVERRGSRPRIPLRPVGRFGGGGPIGPPDENIVGHTLRLLRGRQPLCGIVVTSRIEVMVKPADCNARSADSRPEPGPATSTSSVRMPCSAAFLATSSAGDLRRIGGRFPRSLESHGARRRPGDRIALGVGDGDHGVVERGVHMRHAGRDVLAFTPADAGSFLAHSRSFRGAACKEPSRSLVCRRALSLAGATCLPARTYFFLPAMALAGPLRVRALVWVRWPRTGSPRRCRNPR